VADDWRSEFRNRSYPGMLIHPDSPAGGSGAGFARAPGGPDGYCGPLAGVPRPDSPAAQYFPWQLELPRIDLQERTVAVWQAITLARRYVPEALRNATGQELHEIVAAIVPGLVMLTGILAASTALGAAAGAAIGALAFGVGAAPGAVAGASLGFEAGVVILDFLGLAFLAGYIGKSLMEASVAAGEAVQTAWHSVDDRGTQQTEVDRAARRLAFAVGLVFRGVLQGIVAFLLARGTAAAAERVPELITRLRKSKLGGSFAAWVERNWKALIANPRLTGDRGSGPRGGSGSTQTAPPPPPSSKPLPKDDSVPEGLAYRKDLPDHLAGPDGFKAGKLHGTHNLDNAVAALQTKNAQYSLTPTSTPGISELKYQYFDAAKQKNISGSKTVYDPRVYSDETMLRMAQDAGKQGFEQYANNPAPFYDVTQDGVNFRVYINTDPSTGAPYVGNVHPIK
jgi:hypothetical protein